MGPAEAVSPHLALQSPPQPLLEEVRRPDQLYELSDSGSGQALITILYAAGGLGLYAFATFVNLSISIGAFTIPVGGFWEALILVGTVTVLCLVTCTIGVILGVNDPAASAQLIQPWPLMMFAIGSGVGAIGLYLLGLVTGNDPNANPPGNIKSALDALSAVISGAAGFVVAKLNAAGASWLSKRFISAQYEARFPELPEHEPGISAYHATRTDVYALKTGSVTGWGRKDTETRLRAIKAAL
jgi:hypothetical protein